MVGRLLVQNDGTHSGDDNLPPPSTIAAQLVKNHAEHARGSRQTDDAATFGQLLQEILSRTAAPETDVEVNHKLIQVVVEAGLDTLFQDNPFAQWEVLLPQAADSLAVVESTVRRQSKVLFYEESHQTQAQRQPHLLIWLLPKIFSLSSHPKCDELQGALSSLLRCMVESLSKNLTQWQASHALLDAFRDCVTDLMSTLERHLLVQQPTTIGTMLPPGRSLTFLWSEAQDAVALPSGCQMHVKDAVSGFKIVLLLLSTTIELSNADKPVLRLEAVSNVMLGWVLDVIPCLIEMLLKHRQYFEKCQKFGVLSTKVVRLYGRAVLQLRLLQTKTLDTSPYATARFSKSCANYIFASCNYPLSTEVQHAIGTEIQDIFDMSSKHDEAMVQNFLLPAFRAFASDETRFQACQETLLVPMRSWLLKIPDNHTNGTVAVPDQQGDTTMTDSTAQGPLRSDNRRASVDEQPRKLRNVLKQHVRVEHVEEELYTHLKGQLVGLLTRGNGHDIMGLSLVAA